MKLLQIGGYAEVKAALGSVCEVLEARYGKEELDSTLHMLPEERRDVIDSNINHIEVIGKLDVAKIVGPVDNCGLVVEEREVYRYNGTLYAEAI